MNNTIYLVAQIEIRIDASELEYDPTAGIRSDIYEYDRMTDIVRSLTDADIAILDVWTRINKFSKEAD